MSVGNVVGPEAVENMISQMRTNVELINDSLSTPITDENYLFVSDLMLQVKQMQERLNNKAQELAEEGQFGSLERISEACEEVSELEPRYETWCANRDPAGPTEQNGIGQHPVAELRGIPEFGFGSSSDNIGEPLREVLETTQSRESLGAASAAHDEAIANGTPVDSSKKSKRRKSKKKRQHDDPIDGWGQAPVTDAWIDFGAFPESQDFGFSQHVAKAPSTFEAKAQSPVVSIPPARLPPAPTPSFGVTQPYSAESSFATLRISGVTWDEVAPALSEPGVEDDNVRRNNLAALFANAVAESCGVAESRVKVHAIRTGLRRSANSVVAGDAARNSKNNHALGAGSVRAGASFAPSFTGMSRADSQAA